MTSLGIAIFVLGQIPKFALKGLFDLQFKIQGTHF